MTQRLRILFVDDEPSILDGLRRLLRPMRDEWEVERAAYPRGALHMRFSENHDEKRAIARFGERGALAAAAWVFTSDGIPLLYNGQEAGDVTESGAPALFEPECSLYVYFAEQAPLPHEVRPRARSSAGEQECSPYTGLSLCYTHLAEDVDFGRFREAENIAVVGLGSADCAVSRGVAWMRCVQQFGERAMDGEADWVLCGFDGGESEPAYGGEPGGYFAIWCFGIGIRV